MENLFDFTPVAKYLKGKEFEKNEIKKISFKVSYEGFGNGVFIDYDDFFFSIKDFNLTYLNFPKIGLENCNIMIIKLIFIEFITTTYIDNEHTIHKFNDDIFPIARDRELKGINKIIITKIE